MLCARCYAFTACVLFVLLNENLLIIYSKSQSCFFCHFLKPAVSRNLGWGLGQGQSRGLLSASRMFWSGDKGLQAPCAPTMALFPLHSVNRHGQHLGLWKTNNGSRPKSGSLFISRAWTAEGQLEELHCGGWGHGARNGVSGSSVSQPTVFVSIYLEGDTELLRNVLLTTLSRNGTIIKTKN